MGTWRKAYGALKDSTKVGLAKVNSEFKDLDIAIVKATNHVESPPKERHVRKIFTATSAHMPRADVAYCIYALSRRLAKTRNWIVALKTLIVLHRTLREGDPTFREELVNYSVKGNILQMSNFKDDSSPLAWDCSAWVRTYALYLEERIDCFRALKYDIEAERLARPSQGHTRTRTLCCPDLLEQLPALQQVLYRLIGCQPEGVSCGNFLIQYALALVLKESFKIYCAINDGIINLVEMFFDMSKYDAIKALEIYKRAGQQAEYLADFYEFAKHLELARTFQFPTLRQPPPSFLSTMEEYIREAPGNNSVSIKKLEFHEINQPTSNKEESPPEENEKLAEEEEKQPPAEAEKPPEPTPEPEPEPEPETTGDLLGLYGKSPAASELEESNALALAIIPESNSKTSATHDLIGGNSSGWELALVTTPSNNTGCVAESKLGGGFDKLLLDSLYEDTTRRQQIAPVPGAGLAPNPLGASDPFSMSNGIAAPTNVQMAMMAQQQQQQYYQQQLQQQQYYQPHQQQYYQQQQQMMMMPPYQAQSQNQPMSPVNPFADPLTGVGFSYSAPAPGNHNFL